MRRFALPILAALMLAVPSPGTGAGGGRVLTGDYYSNHGDGPVTARFTPAGEGRWDVTFDFVFSGREHTYRGTARGGFADGETLRGRVNNEHGRRTFTLRGELENGVFRGTHAEVRRTGERRTGTIVLEE